MSAPATSEKAEWSSVQNAPPASRLVAHSNPLFNTREYVVDLTDGSTENYFANVIAECMYAQVDSEGNQYQFLSEITDHRSDNSAVPVADGFVISRNGNRGRTVPPIGSL